MDWQVRVMRPYRMNRIYLMSQVSLQRPYRINRIYLMSQVSLQRPYRMNGIYLMSQSSPFRTISRIRRWTQSKMNLDK